MIGASECTVRRPGASMGPRVCARGMQVSPSQGKYPIRLQWGREFVLAEWVLDGIVVVAMSIASMGPRVCARGMLPLAVRCCALPLVASMGPRVCARGMTSDKRARNFCWQKLQWGREFVLAEWGLVKAQH